MKTLIGGGIVACALLVARVTAAPASTPAVDPAERGAVLGVVQQFFDAMAARDVVAARRTLLPDGQFYVVRADASGTVTRRTHEDYLARLSEGKERLLERIWDPIVTVHGRIATVWAPYDFHRDGGFSHSGVDAFTLIRTGEGWRIASLVYTVEPAVPSRHPAGPPARAGR